MVFIDIEKVFGRVPTVNTWECLRKRNVHSELCRVIKYMYKETRNFVICCNVMSEVFITLDGIRKSAMNKTSVHWIQTFINLYISL